MAFVLLALTFNPTEWNLVRWARTTWPDQMPVIVLAGLILFTGYVIYLCATVRSIGAFGMALAAAIYGALILVLIDLGVLVLGNRSLIFWLGSSSCR